MENLGIASVAAITVLVGLAVKLTPWDNDRLIPVVCGVAGLALGLLWFFMGWGDFPAGDPVTAAAVGVVSGLAATGVNQVYKQLAGSRGDG